jgi:hypothetical protein
VTHVRYAVRERWRGRLRDARNLDRAASPNGVPRRLLACLHDPPGLDLATVHSPGWVLPRSIASSPSTYAVASSPLTSHVCAARACNGKLLIGGALLPSEGACSEPHLLHAFRTRCRLDSIKHAFSTSTITSAGISGYYRTSVNPLQTRAEELPQRLSLEHKLHLLHPASPL